MQQQSGGLHPPHQQTHTTQPLLTDNPPAFLKPAERAARAMCTEHQHFPPTTMRYIHNYTVIITVVISMDERVPRVTTRIVQPTRNQNCPGLR